MLSTTGSVETGITGTWRRKTAPVCGKSRGRTQDSRAQSPFQLAVGLPAPAEEAGQSRRAHSADVNPKAVRERLQSEAAEVPRHEHKRRFHLHMQFGCRLLGGLVRRGRCA